MSHRTLGKCDCFQCVITVFSELHAEAIVRLGLVMLVSGLFLSNLISHIIKTARP